MLSGIELPVTGGGNGHCKPAETQAATTDETDLSQSDKKLDTSVNDKDYSSVAKNPGAVDTSEF